VQNGLPVPSIQADGFKILDPFKLVRTGYGTLSNFN